LEFVSDPVSEGWAFVLQDCAPQTWNYEGWYHQRFDLDACPPLSWGRDIYRRSLEALNGQAQFFTEFRLRTNGDRSEIPYGGPTLLALGNDGGVLYHITVSRDLVKFLRDVDLPIGYIEIEPDIPHVIRLELSVDWYAFYIDGELIDEGVSEGPFPASNPRISCQGNARYLPCENAWDYIRVGRIPDDASGDYDSDAVITASDFYFFHECLTNQRPGINGGPDLDAGPGCRFADFDSDSDVDLLDFAEFQNLFIAP
jgi:hypothetical protein